MELCDSRKIHCIGKHKKQSTNIMWENNKKLNYMNTEP